MSNQKCSYNKRVICGFVLGIIIVSVICFISAEFIDFAYLGILIFYFFRYIFLLKTNQL